MLTGYFSCTFQIKKTYRRDFPEKNILTICETEFQIREFGSFQLSSVKFPLYDDRKFFAYDESHISWSMHKYVE